MFHILDKYNNKRLSYVQKFFYHKDDIFQATQIHYDSKRRIQKEVNVLFHEGPLSFQTVYDNSMNANITEHLFFRLDGISDVLSNHFIAYIIILWYEKYCAMTEMIYI